MIGTLVASTMQDYGVIMGYKHLVLNEQEFHRESLGTFVNEQALREIYLRAFEGPYTEGGALGTMTAFNRIGVTYCGTSRELLTDLMRGEWGYKGHITSDALVGMSYKTHYIDNVVAGLDYFCWDMKFGSDSGEFSNTVMIREITSNDDGNLLQVLRDATKHNLYAASRSILINGLDSRSTVRQITPWWQTALYIAVAVLAILTLVPLVLYYKNELADNKRQGGNMK